MSLAKLTKICQRQQRHSGVDFKKDYFFSPPVAGNLPCLWTARKRERVKLHFYSLGLAKNKAAGEMWEGRKKNNLDGMLRREGGVHIHMCT